MEPVYKPGQLPYPTQDDRKKFCKYHYKGVLIILIPMIFAPILLGNNMFACRMIYCTIVIYLYYIFNVMAQGATAFLFMIALPLFGIQASKQVCISHYSDIIFTTYGSIFMGIMMESSKVSQRLAIIVIRHIGTNLRYLSLFFLLISAACSFMFNSTFVAAFWMRIALSIITDFTEAGLMHYSDEEPYEHQSSPYPKLPAIGVYLSVCYGANLGCMISPFQEPNGAIYDQFNKFSNARGTSFIVLFILQMVICLIVVALWLNIVFLGLLRGKVRREVRAIAHGYESITRDIQERVDALGPWNAHGILVVLFIGIAGILCFTRRPIFFDGWADQIQKVKVGDSVAIILMAILSFSVPANYFFCRYYACREPLKEGTAPSLVGWRIVNSQSPWGHVFMLCCGFGFCEGLKSSTLLRDIGRWFVQMKIEKTTSIFCGVITGSILTTLSAATPLARACLDTILDAGTTLKIGRGTLGLPFSAGLHNNFLLPVSSPANTVVAGWGNIRPFQYLIAGSVPFVFMLLSQCLFVFLLGTTAFDKYDERFFVS